LSQFSDAFSARQNLLDKRFGEVLELRRAVEGEFTRGAAVASDPPIIVVGILDVPTDVFRANGPLDAAKSELLMERPVADFAASLFSGILSPPQEGDEIVAVNRAGSPRYRVLDTKPDGVSRIVCQLAPL